MSRLDRLKEQHSDLNISLIDIISFLDPTDSYKYTEFLIKNFKNDSDYYSSNKDEFMGYLGVFLFGPDEITVLNEFERHSKANRIKDKDISRYSNFEELESAVQIAEEIEKRKKLEKEILKIHEDDTWLILTPLSFEASKVYGANTKWCVTQEKYWDKYLITHRLIYVLNKKTDTKIAFSRDFKTNKFQAWDQLDVEVDPMFIYIPDELFLKIKNNLKENKTTGDLIGIQISEIPNDIVSQRDMALRMWDTNRVYDGSLLFPDSNSLGITINRDSRSLNFSNDMAERVKRLISNQYDNRTISDNPDLNHISNYDHYLKYDLDDLP